MSYQPPPEQQPPPQDAPPAGRNAVAKQAAAQKLAAENELIEKILGGELPGQGYLYASDPEERQKQLIQTKPEFVRANILRAIEVMTFDLQLVFSEDKKADIGHAMLFSAQAYLLLDPTVDENGVPVEGPGSVAHANAAAAHQFPPRVAETPAEAAVKGKHEPQEKALKGTRGQTPTPQPRVSG